MARLLNSRPGAPAPSRPNRGPLTSTRTTDLFTFLLVGIAVALATISGLSAGSRLGQVLPIAVAVGAGMGLLALSRFESYVLVLLAARASLDLVKLSGSAELAGPLGRINDPAGILGFQFVLMALLWLAAQHRAGRAEPASILVSGLSVFVAACVLSLAGSQSPVASLVEISRLLAAVMMLVVLERLMAGPRFMRRALVAVYLSALFPIAFTAMGVLMGSPRSEDKGSFVRLLGTFNQSNTFGRYLMYLLVFGVAMWPHLDKPLRSKLTVILAGCAVFLPLTYTRSAIVGAVLGLVVVGLLQNRRLLGVLAVVAVIGLGLVPRLDARFTDLTGGSDGQAGNTLNWRFEYWADVLPLAGQNPVWGIGVGETQRLTEQGKQPHNDFLRALVETGIIGFSAYLFVLAAMVRVAYRALDTTQRGPGTSIRRGVAVGFAGCVASFIAVSMVANTISNVVTLWYFLTFAAAAHSVARSKEPSSDGDRGLSQSCP